MGYLLDVVNFPETFGNLLQPEEFLNRVQTQSEYKINNVLKISVFATDKAMMFAAAYLSVKYPVPETQMIEQNNDENFPYLIAVDKYFKNC